MFVTLSLHGLLHSGVSIINDGDGTGRDKMGV